MLAARFAPLFFFPYDAVTDTLIPAWVKKAKQNDRWPSPTIGKSKERKPSNAGPSNLPCIANSASQMSMTDVPAERANESAYYYSTSRTRPATGAYLGAQVGAHRNQKW